MRRPETTWLGRLLRGWRPDHNPLRRRSDRIETALAAMLLIVFAAAAPFAWRAASSLAYASSHRQALAEQASLRRVPASWTSATRWPSPGPTSRPADDLQP